MKEAELPNAALVTSRKFLDAEPLAAEMVIKSVIEGIHFYKTEQTKTPAILKKYMKVENAEELQETYEFYVKMLAEKPYPSARASRLFSIGRKEPMPERPTPRSSSTLGLSKNWTGRVLSMGYTKNSESRSARFSELPYASYPLFVSPLAKGEIKWGY